MYIPGVFSATNAARSRQTVAFSQGYDIGATYIYPFDKNGFGTKYSLSNDIGSSTYGQYVTFTVDGQYMGVGHEQSPYAQIFPWDHSTGTGTKFSNPTGLNNHSRGIAFNRTRATVSVGTNGGPSTFPFTSSGWGTKYSAPGSQPTGTGFDVEFNNMGDVIAHSYGDSPGVHVYPWTDGTGYGTKYTAPGGISGGSEGCKFNYDGTEFAYVNDSSPYLYAWPFTKGTGFGTKYSNMSPVAASSGRGVAWSKNSKVVFYAATGGQDYLSAYPFTKGTGWGTKYSTPSSAPNALSGLGVSKFDEYVAVAIGATPYAAVYPFNQVNGWGTKFANPATLPVRGVNSANWISSV